ncbi:MAG: hypothetical protein WA957_01145 [Alteraurantiacibacter sp.]
MSTITKALAWAAVIIGFAVAAASGLVENDVAQVMTITLPGLAWATIGNRVSTPCPLGRKAGGA